MSATETTSDALDIQFMRLALGEARKSKYIPSAFCVGCVIVTSPQHPQFPSQVLATGYSRELEGNTHAEQCAFDKLERLVEWNGIRIDGDEAKRGKLLKGSTCYTTMEPCSVRLSGNPPCVDRILSNEGVTRVVVGCEEPKDFVECEGTDKLRQRGRKVCRVVDADDPDLGSECLKVARGQA